jgi:glutamate racemase
MDDRPIGMFDSGFGGLTVARAVIDLLPAERLVYVGDTGRYPYGPRPLRDVRGFALEIARHLVDDHGVKLLVVACNTAAAAAPLVELERMFGVPVVGVVEPGVRSVVQVTHSGRVGVIGTVGTIASGAYQRSVARQAPHVELTCAACPGFVEFVERGDTASDQVHVLAERLLAPLRDAKVDALLLGCTHYPFLARTISDVMGRDVVLVSSADETAFEVRARLEAEGLRAVGGRHDPDLPAAHRGDAAFSPLDWPSPPPSPRGEGGERRHRWLSSGDVRTFRELGRRLLGPELDHAEPVPWA